MSVLGHLDVCYGIILRSDGKPIETILWQPYAIASGNVLIVKDKNRLTTKPSYLLVSMKLIKVIFYN